MWFSPFGHSRIFFLYLLRSCHFRRSCRCFGRRNSFFRLGNSTMSSNRRNSLFNFTAHIQNSRAIDFIELISTSSFLRHISLKENLTRNKNLSTEMGCSWLITVLGIRMWATLCGCSVRWDRNKEMCSCVSNGDRTKPSWHWFIRKLCEEVKPFISIEFGIMRATHFSLTARNTQKKSI